MINERSISVKSPNIWKLKKTLLSNPWDKEEIIREVRKSLQLNDYESTKYQNLWDSVKAVLRGKFIMLILLDTKKNSKINI